MSFIKPIKQTDQKDKFFLLHDQLRFIKDPELLILKGHLLVEHLLNELLTKFDKSGEATDSLLRFKFSDKLIIAKTLGVFLYPSGKHIFENVYKLNVLRNKLSHNLHYDKNLIRAYVGESKWMLKTFTELTERINLDRYEDDDLPMLLDFSLTGICSVLIGRIESIIAINNEYAALTDRTFEDRCFARIDTLKDGLNIEDVIDYAKKRDGDRN
jgi:hypothetical protein